MLRTIKNDKLKHTSFNFCNSPSNISTLKFNDVEISELCSFISFISSCQKLGRIYNLTEDLQLNKVTTLKEIKNVG